MKTYVAQRPIDDEIDDCRVSVIDDQQPGVASPLHHVKLHSDSFEWGYRGGGPADLALSILAEHYGKRPSPRQLRYSQPDCWRYHQAFKRAFIAGAPRAGFQITGAQIDQWLSGKQPEES